MLCSRTAFNAKMNLAFTSEHSLSRKKEKKKNNIDFGPTRSNHLKLRGLGNKHILWYILTLMDVTEMRRVNLSVLIIPFKSIPLQHFREFVEKKGNRGQSLM